MSQTPNLDAARASLQQAIDQANAIVKPIIDAMREAGMLTPAPEAAATPAVDDLGSIIRWLCAETRNMLTEDEMSDLLASEPMQRLRAAWTAEAEAQHKRDIDAAQREYAHLGELYDRMCSHLTSERDEARAEATDYARDALNAHAEVERLRAELTATIERWNRAYTEVVKDMNEGWKADRGQLKAEVERLRAAQREAVRVLGGAE